MSLPKVLLAKWKPENFIYHYSDAPFFFDERCRDKSKNACGYLGLSSSLLGDFAYVSDFSKFDFSKYGCIILPVGGLEDMPHVLPWLRGFKKQFPQKITIGQSETGSLLHRIHSRNWELQKIFYEFSNLVDIMTTLYEPATEYFQLFCNRQIIYLPHPYPVEYFDQLGEFKTREQKDRVLMKGGHMHGRLFTDGFADAVVLKRIKDRYPKFKIQIQDDLKTRYLINQANYFSKDFNLNRPLSVMFRKVLHSVERIESKAGQIFKQHNDGKDLGKPEYALTLRGIKEQDIIKIPHCSWSKMIQYWAKAFAAIDMDYGFITGRNVCDAVATGTPIIGCNSDFQKQLLPELIVDIGEYEKAEKLLIKLIEDQEFYNDLVTKGRKRLEAFSFENTRKRFVALLAEHKKG